MRKKKRLQELKIKDNFMFGAVMLQKEHSRSLLEKILGIDIDHVEISKKRSYYLKADAPFQRHLSSYNF